MITSPGSISVSRDQVDPLLAAGGDDHRPRGRRACPRPPSPRRCSPWSRRAPRSGPYCSAFAHDSCGDPRARSPRTSSGGNVLVSGKPPASEITSGRAVIAIRSRIADDFMTLRARGEQAGVALEVARDAHRTGSRRGARRPAGWSIVMRPEATGPGAAPMSLFLDIGQGAGLAGATGVRPFLPPLLAGALAREDAGIDFDGTDWSFLEDAWLPGRRARAGRRRLPGRALAARPRRGEAAAATRSSLADRRPVGLVLGALLFAGPRSSQSSARRRAGSG